MSVGTTAAIALGVGALASTAGSIAGGVIQGNAAKSAANTQAAAANQVGQEAQTAATSASGDVNTATSTANAGLLASQGGLTASQNQQLANLAPYTTAGSAALTPLTSDIASETNPSNSFSFTPQQYQQNPAYAYQMQTDEQALQQQNAAAGGALTGGAVKGAETLANNLTSTNYNTAYNQALQTYTTNRQNLLNQIQGYQGIVGNGLTATNSGNTAIGNTASQVNQSNAQIAANQIAAGTYQGNAGLTAAQIQAQALTGAANASAAGTIGQANATTNAINGVANGIGTTGLLTAVIAGSKNSGGTGGSSSGNSLVPDTGQYGGG